MSDSPRERYRLERRIGEGGFGDVWLATDTLLDRPVAVKCPKATDDPIRRERFLVEARLLARLNHPNITQIHDAFYDEDEGNLYLVMEYVDGRNLSDIIEAGNPLRLDIILEVAVGILRALSYAHQQGIVHRDVKLANVMIADDVKLTDFGTASLRSILDRGTGFMAGTPAYMAPEQIEGQAIDGRADLYALGVLLFEMLSGGRLPFEHTDPVKMLDAHLHTAPPPISQFAPTVPPALEQVVARLLAKDPEERFPSAEAVIEVLESIHVGPQLTNLPVALTSFVGREAELAEIQECLGDPACRLLTLVGPGGCGKTRLAVEAATPQIDNYPHGVFFVRLAPLDSVEGIVPTVAEALGFRFYEEGEPQQQLLDYLRQKRILLILDNFEHLVEGAGLVTDILQIAPGVKILATSRARLNVGGEHLYPVAGMHYPDRGKLEDPDRYSAIKLFMQSARRVRPSFEPSADDMTDVVRICRLLEGMPLAMLLATAWMEMLSPAEIAAEISRSLDFLEADLRDVPERHRSMRAVFDHSWKLLTEREKEVFQALSVFRGGFTREAAQEVTGASLRELMVLVHKSLVQRTATRRYDMHELLRSYAAEKLETSEQTDVARDAHSAYFAEFLHQREADLQGRRQLEALDEIEADFDNVRAAWNWALNQKNYTAIGRLVRNLGFFCAFRSRHQEHEELFLQAREKLAPGPDDEPHPVWGRILVAEFYARRHKVDSAQIERGLAILQKHGDLETKAWGLQALGEAALDAEDYTGAISLFEKSLAFCRDVGLEFHEAAARYWLAETYRLLGQPDKAIKFARHSLNLSREIGDRYWAASSLANTGVIALYTGNYTEAEGYLREASTLYREIGYKAGIAESCVQVGRLAFIRGNFEKAGALAGEALRIATDLGRKRVAQSAFDLNALVARTLGEKAEQHPDVHEPFPVPDVPRAIDQYKVKRLLGVGRFSAVFHAYDPKNRRDVAIVLADRETFEQFDWFAKRLKRAAEFVANLEHSAIPECYNYVETPDHAYIVVEYVRGEDLETILEEQEGFLSETDVLGWAIQVCDALV